MARFNKPAILLSFGLIALMHGCNRPAWEQKSAARGEKIDEEVQRYAKYDAEGIERLDRMSNLIRKRRGYHEEHLEKTSAMVRKEWESDERDWYQNRPRRRAFISRQWHAKPDTIPSTWAKMVY